MSARRTRLIDCNPRWGMGGPDGGPEEQCWITFECPEDHDRCCHSIPFTPSLQGEPQHHGVQWQRSGDTFETLTLSPSIKRNPRHASREAAIAAGCIPEYITESLLCAFHGFVGGSGGQTPGAIEFCGDSR